MKKIVASLVTLALFAGFASAETKIDAAKLVGKWEVTKSDGDAPKGAIVEFLKDGKFDVMIEVEGKKADFKGVYKVTGDKLLSKLIIMGKEMDEDTDTIKTLSDDELVTIDKNKKETTFKKKK